MGFFEFAIGFSVVVLLPVLIVKMTLDYKRHRLEAGISDEVTQQTAVTVGELKELVRDIVAESHADLAARIEALEEQSLDTPADGGDVAKAEPRERTMGRSAS